MNAARATLAYRRLRAPRTPDGVLLEPPQDVLGAALLANRAARHAASTRLVGGLDLASLSRLARRDLLTAAHAHASRFSLPWADELVGPAGEDDPKLLVTGHQPQLFHPGVWFKNFVLDHVARRTHSLAVNLIIDNDTQRGASVKAPTGTVDAPRAIAVPWDQVADEVPYEQRLVRDETLFESFAERLTTTVEPLVSRPLVQSLWPLVLEARSVTRQPGLLFSVGRNRLERQFGLKTIDVPLSDLVDADAFRRFALELFSRAGELRDVYNQVLAEYRESHRIRSRSHPVPELAQENDWIEAPFWCWSDRAPRRRRLFVRATGTDWELTDRAGWRDRLPGGGIGGGATGDVSAALARWRDWRRAGVKIRPRALVTTLFSRLLLGDLFVHGIGGAKYDQLTDALFERFLGFTAPTFVTATATVCLPIPHSVVTNEDVWRLEQRLRASRFHPEAWLSSDQLRDDYVARLVAEKRRWLATEPPRGSRLTRHRALGALNEALQQYLGEQRESWSREIESLRVAAQQHALLASREYSYCVFSNDDLPHRLLELSARNS